ncbi:YitT family protein [Alkalihalobacterium alkalinitrilicum]|uniref:YitT family protein n=1 Tax=Alkalihalobacterium alkalinitrilicum TaxID=427920 RepID=UPI00099500F1|nr:YitT family protein [Alkalihalobacterium alkalinitrilicum]
MNNIFTRWLFIIVGLFITSLGLRILAIHDFTFGGTAGVATVLDFLTNWSWGILFFLVNLPFFIISIKKLGMKFTISSLVSITAISFISEWFQIFQVTPFPDWIATIVGGLFIGIGVTFVLNNGSSLGGIHILALYLDQKFKVNRGVTIFASDFLIIFLAGILVGWSNALLSVGAIFIASSIIGRYKKSPINESTVEEDKSNFSSVSAQTQKAEG